MLFKRIRMSGFKSFADKVDFEFGPGVTCIVGPNGCGKSNVVDAVKWVLGEQSAKSLRGRQMVDMIFNGSSARRSASVAQIDLVFDNSDHLLAVDREEVTVTRKLYRSGDSEYLLNNEAARLKDIREMFMDTGVGIEAYSIIEQGKVDVLLQSSPSERRMIFEEAAGISRFKARKRDAQRKMERTEQNLLRVEDIVEEVEKRLRSVKLQAGKARNYLEYESQLNELRASFSMAEYHRFSMAIEELSTEARGFEDQSTELRTKIDQQEAAEAQVTVQLDELAEEISETDNQLVRARSDLTTYQERIDAAGRRLADQQDLLERSVEREEGDRARLKTSEEELERLAESARELQRETDRLRGRISELEEQDRSLARDVTQAQAMLDDEKAGIIELLRKSAQTHNEIIRLDTHGESLAGQKGRLRARDEQITAELQEHLQRKADLERRLGEVEELIAAETAKLEQKKEEAVRVRQLRAKLSEQLTETKERRSALHSRRELLADLQLRKDGIGAGVRKLLDIKESAGDGGPLSCVLGLVADVFDTDVTHAGLIEAVLGDADQCLVVSDSKAFVAGLGSLGELPGRVTAFCLDRLPPAMSDRGFSDQPGYVSRALDLVRYAGEVEYLARHLFEKTIVVETLEVARSLAREDISGYRFVTLAGEVVDADGRVSLGPPSSRAGLISRKSELRDIDIQMVVIDEEVVRLSDQLNRFQAESDHLEHIQQELRGAIYESNTAKVEANASLQNVTEAVRRLSDEQPLIAAEVTSIEQQIAEVAAKAEEGGESLEALQRENQQRERIVADHQLRIDGIVESRRDVQGELTELKVSAGQLSEKRIAAADTITTLRRQIRELQSSIEVCGHDREQCEGQITEASRVIAHGQEQVCLATESIDKKEATATDLRRKREQLRLDLETLGTTIKSTRVQMSEVEQKRHEIDMSLAETNVRRDELVSRVESELSIDLAKRYDACEHAEHAEQDWEAVETQIADLRGKIDRLGNVNLDAISELEELQTRHGFLTTQRDDLTVSLRQLEQLIQKLDDESLQRFRAAFDSIRGHFQTLFRKLFGGGRADVILEDPDNILECGIEILAQPPGKELQSISLMSGGEKTMTAIALLMSVFKSRPAPFAILDEVDAALDEANNERFNQIVHEFVQESQFIIITHSKRTMSIADMLYGITMQEPGVSTRVSVQFDNAQVA